MLQANVNGKPVTAGSDAPDTATCPACGGEVQKRSRRIGKNRYTHYYRHANGIGEDCPLRGPGMGRVGR